MNYKEFFIKAYRLICDKKPVEEFNEIETLGYLYRNYPNAVKETLSELYYKSIIGEVIYVKVMKLIEIGDIDDNQQFY